MGLKLLLANPDTQVIKNSVRDCYISAYNSRELAEAAEKRLHPSMYKELFMKVEEGTIIIIETVDGAASEVSCYRSITSSSEIYYLHDAKGDLMLSDSFRNALSMLEVKDRECSEDGVVDYFLYQTTPGHSTHISRIKRLGHGELLRYTVSTKDIAITIEDKLQPPPSKGMNFKQRIAGTDKVLASIIQGDNNTVTLMTGGVDSTLLHTYLGNTVPSMSAGIDCPEFSREIEYATQASKLLNTHHTFNMLKEENYLQDLEGAAVTAGLPLNRPHAVLIADLLKNSTYSRHLVGHFADALYGLNMIKYGRISLWAKPLANDSLHWLWPKSTHRKLKHITDILEDLKLDAIDPNGYAFATFGVATDMAPTLLGPEKVYNRLKARRDYFLARHNMERHSNEFWNHCELGSLTDLLCDDTVSIWRQIAHAQGKSLYNPYITKTALYFSLTIPVKKRYIRGLRQKYILKRLLSQRLPGYPAYQPKGGSRLPHLRFCDHGPLKDFFEIYPVPDNLHFLTREALAYPTSKSNWLYLSAVMYTLWVEKVVKDPNLSLSPGTKVNQY